ncbi:MAG: cellulase family glycosylhydrolase [Prolixibacteraceae bacterium]
MKRLPIILLSFLIFVTFQAQSQSSFTDDFTDSVSSQWKVDEAYTATIDNGAMKIEINKQAGQELHTVTLEFPESLDLSQTPYFSLKIKADTLLVINPVFVDENERIADADIFDGTGDPFNTYNTGDDFLEKEFSTINFSGVDWDNSAWPPNAFYPVDFTKIKQLSFLINHNGLAAGTIWIDDLKIGNEALQHNKTAHYNNLEIADTSSWEFDNAFDLNADNGSLKININKNADNQYSSLSYVFENTLDLSQNPFISIRVKSNSEVTIDPTFQDVNERLADGDRFEIEGIYGDETTTINDGEFTTYTFSTKNFTGVDWDNSAWPPDAYYDVDFTQIKKIIFLINHGIPGETEIWIDDLAVGSIAPEAQKSKHFIAEENLTNWIDADGFELSYDSTLKAVQIVIDKTESNKYSAFGLSLLPTMSLSENPYIQIVAKSSNGVILDPLFEDVYGLDADGDRPAAQDEQIITADGFKTYKFSTTQFEAVDWSTSGWPPNAFMPVDFDFIHKIVLLTNHGVVEQDTLWIKSIAVGKLAHFETEVPDYTYLEEAVAISKSFLAESTASDFNTISKSKLEDEILLSEGLLKNQTSSQIEIDDATVAIHHSLRKYRNSKNNDFSATGRFYVDGNNIIDPEGNIFIARGVNAHGPKYGWSGNWSENLDEMFDAWQFNLVRINARITDATWNGENIAHLTPWQTIEEMHEVIEDITSRGVVAMIDYHDATGEYFTGELLEQLKDEFRYLCDTYKDNPYVWFNIANEPGGWKKNIAPWIHQHQEVIKVIRDEKGADNLIVVDGIYWAQEFDEYDDKNVNEANTAILAHGDEILNFEEKEYNNIVFSIHNYDKLNVGKGDGIISQDIANNKLADLMQRILNKGYALIIGEYGTASKEDEWDNLFFPQAFYASIEVSSLMNIGRVWWAWGGFDALDLTTLGNGGGQYIDHWFEPKQLTWAGDEIFKMTHWYMDIEAPSEPTISEKNNTSTTITVDIDESSDNVGVIGYKVYIDNEFYAYAPNQEINISGLTKEKEYSIQASAVDYAGNESTLSPKVMMTPGKTAIENSFKNKVKVFPNPVNSILNINGLYGDSFVEVFNSNGRLVYSQQGKANNLRIDVSKLPAGMLLLNIRINNEVYTEKIIKSWN